jgi:hypothetical protein
MAPFVTAWVCGAFQEEEVSSHLIAYLSRPFITFQLANKGHSAMRCLGQGGISKIQFSLWISL